MFAQKNKPENINYDKNQASKNSSVSKKHKEGDTGSTLFAVLTF